MISGIPAPNSSLTRENILLKISEEDIFSYFLPGLKYGRAMLSPFRRESHPSFYVNKGGDRPLYSDFADSGIHGDCFDLVCNLYNASLIEAMQIINESFGLGLEGGPKKDYQRIVLELEKPKEKERSIIEVVSRDFNERELRYWSTLQQSRDDLEREEIYAVDHVLLNGKIVNQEPGELAFAYGFGSEHDWKIYYPERTQKHGKWISNIPTSTVEGLQNLENCKQGIISKSRKDRMVLQKFFPHVMSLQNETRAGLTEDVVAYIRDNCERPYLLFDNDVAGRKNSNILCQEFGFTPLFIPAMHQIKDPAGWVGRRGVYPLTEFLMQELKL